MRLFRLFVLIVLMLVCAGCYTVRVERPIAGRTPFALRQHYFLLGLVGEYDVDLSRECPKGIAAFGDRFTFWDVLFAIGSIGIYTPRTVVVQCAA